MTQEVGTVSGELDVAVDDKGYGLVRYRGTDTWYTIGNLEATEPCTWSDRDELVSAILAVAGTRDAAGNTIPFEARKDDAAEEPAPANEPTATEGESGTASEEPAASPAADEPKPTEPTPDSTQPASSTDSPEQQPPANRPEAKTGVAGALQRLVRKLRKPR